MADSGRATASVVSAKDLSKVYVTGPSSVKALDGISLQVDPGEFVAVVGPNGAGKSTLLRLLSGVDSATSGTVALGSVDITKLRQRALTRLRRKDVGIVLPEFGLIPTLTIRENVTLPSQIAGKKVAPSVLRKVTEKAGLKELMDRRPAEVSKEQQQLAALCRALVLDPRLIVADDPTEGLDPKSARTVAGELRSRVNESDRAVVVATQDPEVAALADRVLVMEAGKIVGDYQVPSMEQIRVFIEGIDLPELAHRRPTPPARASQPSKPATQSPKESGESRSPSSASNPEQRVLELDEDDLQAMELPSYTVPSRLRGLSAEEAEELDRDWEREYVSTSTGMIAALSQEQVDVIDRAQQILGSLPGSVAPDDQWSGDELTGDTAQPV